MFDVGAPGRGSDGGVFRNSEIGKRFFSQSMNLPKSCQVGNDGPVLPFYIVGDEGFPLAKFIMRPYARRGILGMRQKIFNYRLSRARRIAECGFGIFVQRFRIFRQPLISKVSTAIKVIKAAVCIHNFLIAEQSDGFVSENFIEEMQASSHTYGLVENENINFEPIPTSAIKIRDKLAEYFMYNGSVPWQWEKVRNADF